MLEEKDVPETPSTPSALENAIASSPEVVETTPPIEEAQTPTAEQGETPKPEEEEGRIPYSRFKEKVDEANWYKQQLENRLNQPPPQPIQPTQDPYAGMTAEEKVFWQKVHADQRKIAQEELAKVQPVIDAGRMELAQIKVAEFRRTHSDIKPNSPEEIEIAQRISSGYIPDDAYWAVMGPRGIRVAEEKGKQQVKKQIEAKKQANVESSASVPKQAQPPQKKTFREEFWENWKKEEEGKL